MCVVKCPESATARQVRLFRHSKFLIRKSHQKRRKSSSGGTFYGEKWRKYQRSPAESGSIFQCKKRCFGRYSVGRCSVPATNSNKLWDSLIPVFCLLPPPARKFPQKTLTNPCPSGNIYRQSVRLRIEYGRVPEWPMGTDCKSAAFSFGGSNPPAPTKQEKSEPVSDWRRVRIFRFLRVQQRRLPWTAQNSDALS